MNEEISMDTNNIIQKARDLLVRHGQTKLSLIDPYAIAKAMKYDVVHAWFPEDYRGIVTPDKKIIIHSRYAVGSPEARCVLMHELAHVELGHRFAELFVELDGKMVRCQTFGDCNDPSEHEAHRFAREALMPEMLVKKAINLFENKTISAFDSLPAYLSRLFNVTEGKAENRLKDLSYGQW